MRNRCKYGICGNKVRQGEKYCDEHIGKAIEKFKAYSALYESERQERDEREVKFYNSAAWRNFRKQFLAQRENLLCVQCRKAFASTLHHIKPLKTHWELRLDELNISPLCSPCHSRHELTERNKGRRK
jgi:5-methylcytosine-specific restriction endonuclease McrA